jgi:hypothetical protein
MRFLLKSLLFLMLLSSPAVFAQQADSILCNWAALTPGDSVVLLQPGCNSAFNDYAPVNAAGNTLWFTSDRVNPDAAGELQNNENIFLAMPAGDLWKDGLMHYFFNSDDHTAVAGMTSSGDCIFLYKSFDNGDIYESHLRGGQWSMPLLSGKLTNTEGHEQSFAAAGNLMLVASERPGGIGEHDLYYCESSAGDKNFQWIPLNIANTAGDEVDVRLSPDARRLWFSSNGRSDCRGYDIYMCERDSLGSWKAPVRLPSPLNTDYNDRWFYDAGNRFFLSSDRPGGLGGDDLYFGYLYRNGVPAPLLFDLSYSAGKDTTFEMRRRLMAQNESDTVVRQKPHLTEESTVPKADSITEYYAMVQVGAYYGMSVSAFKAQCPSMRSYDIVAENVAVTGRGIITRFIINRRFTTLKDAMQLQSEVISQRKIKDAFIAVYTKSGERVAIYDPFLGTFVILKAGAEPHIF